jgi:hypothetical protein
MGPAADTVWDAFSSIFLTQSYNSCNDRGYFKTRKFSGNINHFNLASYITCAAVELFHAALTEP